MFEKLNVSSVSICLFHRLVLKANNISCTETGTHHAPEFSKPQTQFRTIRKITNINVNLLHLIYCSLQSVQSFLDYRILTAHKVLLKAVF